MKKISLLLVILSAITFCAPSFVLQAGGWGKKEIHIYDGVEWDEVFMDYDGLSFTALMPEYSGTEVDDDSILMNGETDDADYSILVSKEKVTFNSGEDFKKFLLEDEPGVGLTWLDAKKLGVEYAMKVIFEEDGVVVFGRALYCKGYVVMMATDDTDETRKALFLGSFKVQEV